MIDRNDELRFFFSIFKLRVLNIFRGIVLTVNDR